jgi:hypothetical protein
MTRLKIIIVFGSKPNFDKDAFKYFFLSLNKLQNTYEFCFPDFDDYPFDEKITIFQSANQKLEDFVNNTTKNYDHLIGIITSRFDNNYFFNATEESSIITTDIWDKYFSPPSLFEYLLHSIYCCLIYSQKTLPDREISEKAKSISIGSHFDTRGCVADFTRNKFDDRIDIALGYICDEHKAEITEIFGEEYLRETTIILERKWIGNIEEKNSVAYNLKHIFKFDINKDSGFNKTWIDKVKEKFYDLPADLTGEVLKVVLTALLTYYLIKFGLPPK